MKTAEKKIIKINASAGSGKTHTLKGRFLKLLSDASLDILPQEYAFKRTANTQSMLHDANKHILKIKKYNFSEILALTFTNAAANEMKERIIFTLKQIALGLEEKDNEEHIWTKEDAAHAVQQIFKQYSALNIKTIDSLLHHLVRLCALELEIPPQFEVTFNNTSVIQPVFKDIAQKARDDDALTLLFDNVCQSIMEYKKPFTKFLMSESVADDCAKIVEKLILEKEKQFEVKNASQNPYYLKIKELSKELEKGGLTSLDYLYSEIEYLIKKLNESENISHTEELTTKDELVLLHEDAKTKMMQSAKIMLASLEKEKLSALENFLKVTRILQEGIFKESTYLTKESLDDCLKTASKNKASDQAKRLYHDLCQSVVNFYEINAIIPPALMSLPLLELAKKIEEKVWEYEKEEGIILSDRMPSLVSRALHDEHYLSSAFCRLGAKLTHILFDEFQDTSTAQWQALAPLAREALSMNGSVFFVGDSKQAIYAWRGGDASLFNSAPKNLQNILDKEQFENKILEKNWRSDENIIDWNNRFFSLFKKDILEKAFKESFLLDTEKLLKKIPHLTYEIQDSFEQCLTKISSIYKDVRQEIPPHKVQEKKQGLVQIHTLHLPKERVNLGILSLLAPCVHALRDKRKYEWSDICILTITNKQASLVAEALLSQGIAVVSQGSLLMAEHPIIQEIIACMRFLANPMDEQAFFELLSSQYILPIKIDRQKLLDFTVKKRKQTLFSRFREEFLEEWNLLFKALLDNAGLLTAYDTLCEIYKRFAIQMRHPKSEVFLLRLLEIVHLAETNKCLDLSSFLAWWDEHATEEKAPLPKDTGAVSVMTVHKAKGLEFKAVLIPWHNFIVKPDLETPEKIQYRYKDKNLYLFSRLLKEHGSPYYNAYFEKIIESINTLYVAWTRARKELHIFMPEEAPSRDNVFPHFLDAMLRELCYGENAHKSLNENSTQQNKTIKIDVYDDFLSFGALHNPNTNTEDNTPLIRQVYLRLLEYLLSDDTNSKVYQNAINFLQASNLNLSALKSIDKEELENVKSADNLYYAKQIGFLFNRILATKTSKDKQRPQANNLINNQEKTEATEEKIFSAQQSPPLGLSSLLSKKEADPIPFYEKTRPMDWLPRLKIFRNNLDDLYLNQESQMSANKRGTLMHKCLEHIIFSGDIENDTKRAINAVFASIPNPSFHPQTATMIENQDAQMPIIHTYQSINKEEFASAISWFLSLQEPFGGAQQWLKYALKEHALASKEGKIYRVDLLVNRPHFIRSKGDSIELLAIDYKTGYQGELPDKHNVAQIKNYLTLLTEGLTQEADTQANTVLGMLIYLDRKEIHFVQL